MPSHLRTRAPRPAGWVLAAALAWLAPTAAVAKGKKGKKKGPKDDGPGAVAALSLDLGGGMTGLGMFGFDDPLTEGSGSIFENRAIGMHRYAEGLVGIPLWGQRKDMFYALVGGRLVGATVRGEMDLGGRDNTTSTGFVGESESSGSTNVTYDIGLNTVLLGMGGHTKWTFSQVTFGRAVGTLDASSSQGSASSDIRASVLGVKAGWRAALFDTVALRLGGEFLAYPGGIQPLKPEAVLPVSEAFGFPVYSFGIVAGLQVIL